MTDASTADATIPELHARVAQIAQDIAGPAAAAVDREARFPSEAITALKEAGLLSAAVPAELGGAGLDIRELFKMCFTLGQHCASSAMVVAMHHIQIASLSRHCGDSAFIKQYLRDCVKQQRLIASATSEVGPSGDMRSSVCAVQSEGDTFELEKRATTMSYAAAADDILATARRNGDAAPSDQVMVLALRDGYTIDDVGTWDTMGMRGTCSPGGLLRVKGKLDQVITTPFADCATETMVPYSHLLWGGCWLGIAVDAVSRARSMVRTKARQQPGKVPPAAHKLSELNNELQKMRAVLEKTLEEYAVLVERGDREGLSSVGFTIKLNNAKLTASEMVVEVVTGALRVCGIMAYKNDSPFSLGRHLRDAHSAALMINNERIHATNASLLLVHKGD